MLPVHDNHAFSILYSMLSNTLVQMHLIHHPALHTISINNYVYISDEFAIDAATGVITVVGDLDEENIDMYTLTVQAENDQATGAPPVTVRECS